MPIPTGIWTINMSGTLNQLNIAFVDPAGNMSGALLTPTASTAISGFWDELSQKLSFASVAQQSFEGFLFQDRFRMPGLSGASVFTLVGSFQDFGGGSSDRLAFGWYAQIGSA